MRTQFRALSVEPVEDRSLPSAFVFVDPGFSYRAHDGDNVFALASQGRGWQARTFQAESFVRVRFSDDSFLIIRETPTGFQLIPVTLGTKYSPPVPVPPVGPSPDGGNSSGNGSGQGGDSGSASTPVAASRGPVRSAAAGTAVGEVAIAPPAQSNTPALPANADQSAAANAAAQVAIQNGPPAVAQTTPAVNGHAAYAITAIVPEGDGADVAPRTDPTPMPGPSPAPAPDTSVESGIIELAATAVAPVAGLVPLDLTALRAGAGQFLDQVADLSPSWPDSMPAFTDTLWVATAALLTGGAIHAATARSAPRPVRDPVASALSEWERRNGRAAG